ncbi:uncharacterized protein LOC62_07G008837 [Vanrija pseudolonga]|uniref:F-box domain-containing protein n=1 Tax=Vanrija pseudolonga TaxID=143232 RepID=A0AAF0YGU9_9TREE|nr:hypothetical protein LOC62_07G008837 [Vanrija pseudolonga]
MTLEASYRVSLPEEIVYYIASCITDVGDLCNATAVSQQWQRACSPHIERHLRDVYPRDRQELELRLEDTKIIAIEEHHDDRERWSDVSWRALGLSYALRDDKWTRDWKAGNVTTRWVPHVFERDDVSISAAFPRGGDVLCTKDYIYHPDEQWEEDRVKQFKTFSFDNRLVPAAGTRSGTFIPSKFPDGEHYGCVDVPGMGPVLLFAPYYSTQEEIDGHDHDDPPHDTQHQVLEVWVTAEESDRWTGLGSTRKRSEFAGGQIPEGDWSDCVWEYLATIPFRIDMCDGIPPLDRVVSLHVDYDRDGARTLVAAHSYQGRAIVRRVAEANRLLDPDGKPTLANEDNLVTTFEHGLLGDFIYDWGEPLCYTCLDNDYVFAAQRSAVAVWSRATGEHVVTIDSTLAFCGPFFDLDQPRMEEQSRVVETVVFKRQAESVPSSTTAVRRFNIECALPDEGGYDDIVHRDVPAGQFQIGPDTLILAGGNLIFWAERRVVVLVDYASVFRRALEMPRDEEQPQFYQSQEEEDNRPPPPVDPRLQEVVGPCLMVFGLDRGEDEPWNVVRAFKHRLLYATEQTTYVLDLSTLPRLPSTQRFSIPVLEVIGVGRNLRTGGHYNQRFFMTNSSVYEVVTLTESQELGSMGNGYLEATQGFPKNVRWRHDWSWPLRPGWQHACLRESSSNHSIWMAG